MSEPTPTSVVTPTPEPIAGDSTISTAVPTPVIPPVIAPVTNSAPVQATDIPAEGTPVHKTLVEKLEAYLKEGEHTAVDILNWLRKHL